METGTLMTRPPASAAPGAAPVESVADLSEAGFTALAARHRRELHVHCYRMLASFEEAEDAVQETFLRAWRGRDGFDGGTLLRAWLYRIATNVCLDAIRRRSRRPVAASSHAEVPWLTPYPDRLLDEAAPTDEQPEAVAVDRETIELAFLVAMQALPPRQRAAFIVRDVLGWPARRCRTGCRSAASSGPRPSWTSRTGPCWPRSSTRTNGATRRPRWRSRP